MAANNIDQVQWIWSNDNRDEWNYFVAFRKSFETSGGERAVIEITADTRYELFVNGQLAGKGPGRGWPEEYFYDVLDITPFLRPGRNCLAVLVHHWGLSTFQHNEMASGLLARLTINSGPRSRVVETDTSWRCARHVGYLPEAQHISCQMAFEEIFDANAFPPDWKEPGFDDSDWAKAQIVPSPLPSDGTMRPLDIEPLSMSELYASRLAGVNLVRKPAESFSLTFRPYLMKDCRSANQFCVAGIIAFVIDSDKDTTGTIHVADPGPARDFLINGAKAKIDMVPWAGLHMHVRLKKGRNLLAMKIDGTVHHDRFAFAFNFPCKIRITGPGNHRQPVCIGPFACIETGWCEVDIEKFQARRDASNFEQVWQQATEERLLLQAGGHLVREVRPPFLTFQCTYGDVVYAAREAVNLKNEDETFLHANLAVTEVSNTPKAEREFLIDFGRITVGYLDLAIEAGTDNIIDLYMFEDYDVHTGKPQETMMNSTVRYICRPGYQGFRSFVSRGGRYVRLVVRGLSPVKLYRLRLIEHTAAMSNRGLFQCEDYVVAAAWDISRHTTRMCMLDTYVDCPTYEQTFWVGDSRNESMVNFYTFGNYEFTKRCLRMVAPSLKRSPLPESQVPSSWRNVLPAWAEFWMSACKEYFEHTADEEFLAEIQPEIVRTVEAFAKFINAEGLFEIAAWNLLDWAAMDTPGKGIVTHQNAFLVKALRDAAALSVYAGKKADASDATKMADRLRIAIDKHLYDPKMGAYVDSIHADGKPSHVFSIQTQTAAYLADIAPKRAGRLEKLILTQPAKFCQIGTPFMAFFYMEALAKMGRPELILPYIRENWGPRMLDRGATACWECFDSTRSHCHAWSAAPGYFLSAYVLGVRPAAPGFARVVVDPVPSGLAWARGCVPTPHGDLYVSWRMKDGEIDLDIREPKGVKVVGRKS